MFIQRIMVPLTQAVFCVFSLVLYVCSPRTAHRLVGYFEEEAVVSFTRYLKEIDEGRVENVAAPAFAIEYRALDQDARLRDDVLAVRDGETGHRDVNHAMANWLGNLQVAGAMF
jgi:ubiquinol oxidase